MRILHAAAIGATVLSLAACTPANGPRYGYGGGYGGYNEGFGFGTKQTVGSLGGAVLGGLAGSRIGGGSGRLIATGVGAVLGGLLGGEVGRSLDRADTAALNQSTSHALEYERTGAGYGWRNPDSGNYGSVTPTRTYTDPYGQTCREFNQTIFVGGRSETAFGTACRQPDGTWKIVG
ncbi:MAG TPA: RT0821/Lpp0805 family surface protein [Alphaproteobacteria bacterium]|nr:RT0821/Lpp0805 family surface protein [Alphaproteobacteria bacterium]